MVDYDSNKIIDIVLELG